MPKFFIDLDGEARDETGHEFISLDDARNAAVSKLGAHLQAHPDFARSGHWRVDLRDQTGRLRLHVVVATVEAAKPINMASFEHELRRS